MKIDFTLYNQLKEINQISYPDIIMYDNKQEDTKLRFDSDSKDNGKIEMTFDLNYLKLSISSDDYLEYSQQMNSKN